MKARYSVLLLEDMPSIRNCLGELISMHPALSLLAAVGSCREALEVLAAEEPDVFVADLGLPDGSGVDMIREACRRYPDIETIVISVFDDEENVVQAFEAGATGYILKDQADGIAEAILALKRGESMISPRVARFLLKRFSTPADALAASEGVPDNASANQLSKREYDVLNCIAKGCSYDEIGKVLGMSTNTVRTHVRNIYKKLAVRSRSEAVFEAANRGLINLLNES